MPNSLYKNQEEQPMIRNLFCVRVCMIVLPPPGSYIPGVVYQVSTRYVYVLLAVLESYNGVLLVWYDYLLQQYELEYQVYWPANKKQPV